MSVVEDNSETALRFVFTTYFFACRLLCASVASTSHAILKLSLGPPKAPWSPGVALNYLSLSLFLVG